MMAGVRPTINTFLKIAELVVFDDFDSTKIEKICVELTREIEVGNIDLQEGWKGDLKWAIAKNQFSVNDVAFMAEMAEKNLNKDAGVLVASAADNSQPNDVGVTFTVTGVDARNDISEMYTQVIIIIIGYKVSQRCVLVSDRCTDKQTDGPTDRLMDQRLNTNA